MKERVYFGWYIAGLFLVTWMLLVSATIGSFGLFVIPVSREMGLSRADMNTAFILLQLGGALYDPFVGRALDKFPVRRIIGGCGILMAISFALLALSQTPFISALVLFLILSLAMAGSGSIPMGVVMVRWFSKNRGKAMLLFNLGAPLNAILIVPIVAKLVDSVGWRITLALNGAALSACVLATAFFMRERPSPDEAEREFGAVMPAVNASSPLTSPPDQHGPARVRDILRQPLFWLVTLAYCLPFGVAVSVGVSIYPFARQAGFSPLEATSLMSAIGFSAVGGIAIVSLIIDRFDRRLIIAAILLIDATAIALMSFVTSYEIMLVAVILLGVSSGVFVPITFTFQADIFGAASFGTIRGIMAPLSALIGAPMIRFAGEVYDRTGTYDLMFHTFAVVEVFSALLICSLFLRPVRKTREVELQTSPAEQLPN